VIGLPGFAAACNDDRTLALAGLVCASGALNGSLGSVVELPVNSLLSCVMFDCPVKFVGKLFHEILFVMVIQAT